MNKIIAHVILGIRQAHFTNKVVNFIFIFIILYQMHYNTLDLLEYYH